MLIFFFFFFFFLRDFIFKKTLFEKLQMLNCQAFDHTVGYFLSCYKDCIPDAAEGMR